MLVARDSQLLFLAFLILISGAVVDFGHASDGPQKCDPLTPMWAGDFEERTGVSPKNAHQCDGEGYSVIVVEFENENDSIAAEKTINENLEGEAELIEGEEEFWEVYWSSSDEFGTLRDSNVLYLIVSPSINASIIGTILQDSVGAISPEIERPATVIASTTWLKTFGGPSRDCGHSVQETTDGGYIVAGETASYGAGKIDVWLIKTDSNGALLWNRTFGGSNDDIGYSVDDTDDGGYIITGGTELTDAGRTDGGRGEVWLIKTDSSGDEIWNRTFGYEGWESAYGQSVQETRDGGFIVTGYNGAEDVWLIKTDANGYMEWDRTFGGDQSSWSVSVQETNDGGYIIASETESFGAYPRDIWLIKTDANGYKEWDKLFGGSGAEYATSVQETADGGYILLGEIESSEDMNRDIWLIKTDADGIMEWERVIGGSNDDRGKSVWQTIDGGYVIAGGTSSYGRGGLDQWLVKVNQSGAEEWNRTFGNPGTDVANSVQQTGDGGFIMTGFISYSADDRDLWLIKTDSQGNVELDMPLPTSMEPETILEPEKSATHIVCPDGCDHSSIQEAVDSANPGDTVEVRSGTYHEIVNVTKTLTIRGVNTGEGIPIVDADGDEYPLILLSEGAKLDGLVATNYTPIISSGTSELCGTYTFDLDLGISGCEAVISEGDEDIFWNQLTETERLMVPRGNATILNIGVVDFDDVTPSLLRSLSFSTTPITGNADDSNQLVEGDVFAVVTNTGNYAKVQVLEYGYSMKIRWVTYSGNII